MSKHILTKEGKLYSTPPSNSGDELYHYGVKGQKWGVRRYQKKDGTLTRAGKRRLAKEQNEYESGRTRRLKKQVAKQREVAKSWDDTSPINIKSAGNKMTFSKNEVKEIRDAAYNRLNKLEVKLVKSQMADKIYSGQSVVSKMYSKVTGAHKIEADLQYDLDKRSKANKAWRD